jgi:hypothetical protein
MLIAPFTQLPTLDTEFLVPLRILPTTRFSGRLGGVLPCLSLRPRNVLDIQSPCSCAHDPWYKFVKDGGFLNFRILFRGKAVIVQVLSGRRTGDINSNIQSYFCTPTYSVVPIGLPEEHKWGLQQGFLRTDGLYEWVGIVLGLLPSLYQDWDDVLGR